MKETKETREWLADLEKNWKAWRQLKKSALAPSKRKEGGSKKAKKRKASKNNELMMFRGYVDFKETTQLPVSMGEQTTDGQWERFV